MKCPECDGTGKVYINEEGDFWKKGDKEKHEDGCIHCQGTGKLNKFQAKQLKESAATFKEINKQLQQSIAGKNAQVESLKSDCEKLWNDERTAREQRDFYEKQAKENALLAGLTHKMIEVMIFEGVDIPDATRAPLLLQVGLKMLKTSKSFVLKLQAVLTEEEDKKLVESFLDQLSRFFSVKQPQEPKPAEPVSEPENEPEPVTHNAINVHGQVFCLDCAKAGNQTGTKIFVKSNVKCCCCEREWQDGKLLEKGEKS